MSLPDTALVRLLQLASPALPVGAYSYSQGLEAAIEAGIVNDAASALAWIDDVLQLSIATMEAPLFLRLCAAWREADGSAAGYWNELVLASRETAELRAETAQMGYSLVRVLESLHEPHTFDTWEVVSFPAAFTYCAVRWGIESHAALIGYLWSWVENQVVAAMKTVPLGQAAGSRMLAALAPSLGAIAARAAQLGDESLSNMTPGLALRSSQHETQYSRLFRS